MKRPSSFHRKSPIELNMTPMIDCVFLLMVYFIWASSFVAPEFFLPGRLSAEVAGGGAAADIADPPPPEKDFDDVVVRITRPGGVTTWKVNDAPVAPPTSASGSEDALVPVTLSATDVDGSIASFTVNGLPAHGTLYLDAARTQPVLPGVAVPAGSRLERRLPFPVCGHR